MNNPGFKFYRPSPQLTPYVRYYWILECSEKLSSLTFPTGCPQIIFHRKVPVHITESGVSQDRFTLSGQVNFPSHIETSGPTEMIVIVFYPHTIGMFISTPPSAFYNQEISGYDLENSEFNALASRIFNSSDLNFCIAQIERWLISRIHPSINIDRIGTALNRMFIENTATVAELAKTACLSKKQFERIFREYAGMNPKEYAEIARFQKSMFSMQQGNHNFADIAYTCGYSDQSHFIREFKRFSGYTPKSLMLHTSPYSDLFTNPL